MQIVIDARVQETIENLEKSDQARLLRHLELLEEYGFNLSSKFVKKLSSQIWELRPGGVRLLFGKVENRLVVVHCFKKQSQKTPRKELVTAQQRLDEYL